MPVYTVSKWFTTRVEQTPEVVAVAQMFGIGSDEDHCVELYKELPVRMDPGHLVLIHGESGAGKSTMLEQLAGMVAADFRPIRMEKIADLEAVPVVSQFGAAVTLQQAMEILNLAGLGEAWVFLRRPAELSEGQRYRLLLALAMHRAVNEVYCHPCSVAGGSDRAIYHSPPVCSGSTVPSPPPILIIDEFGALLDRRTAKAIAFNLRRFTRKTGTAAIVATAHDDLVHDLAADTTVRLRLQRQPEVTGSPA